MSFVVSSSKRSQSSPINRMARGLSLVLLPLLAATACSGSDNDASVRVAGADGSAVDFAVTAPERIEINLADQELVRVSETNSTDQTLEYTIGVAIDGEGCNIVGVPRWEEVSELIEDDLWPLGLTSLPAGGSAGTSVSAEVPGTCRNLEIIVVARSSDGSTSRTELTVPTTAG